MKLIVKLELDGAEFDIEDENLEPIRGVASTTQVLWMLDKLKERLARDGNLSAGYETTLYNQNGQKAMFVKVVDS